MIGKVIEGRYEGASVNKFPDRNVLFVETEDGSRIALSKSNAISVDDVTDQYPSFGTKVMMVMWNDFETSIFLIGVPKEEQKQTVRNKPAETPKSKKKTSKGKTWIILLFVAVVLIAVCGYFVFTQFLNRHEHTWVNATCNVPKTCENCGETEGVPTPHSWIEATCQKPKTCLECGETEGVPTDHSWIEATSQNPKKCANCGEIDKEVSSDIPHNTEDNRPKYTWNVPITLNLPLADVKVGMYKNSSEYWVEFSCDTMDTEEFLTFLIHSTSDWGFDRTTLAERLSIVFRMYDSAWDEGNIAYSSMEGYGIKWTAYGDMKDDNRCVVGLKVNKLNEFEAVCNADIVESTDSLNSPSANNGLLIIPSNIGAEVELSAENLQGTWKCIDSFDNEMVMTLIFNGDIVINRWDYSDGSFVQWEGPWRFVNANEFRITQTSYTDYNANTNTTKTDSWGETLCADPIDILYENAMVTTFGKYWYRQ